MTAEEWDACPTAGRLNEALRTICSPGEHRWRLVHAAYCRARWDVLPRGTVRTWVEMAEEAAYGRGPSLEAMAYDPKTWRTFRTHYLPRSNRLRSRLVWLAYFAVMPFGRSLNSGWDKASRHAIASWIHDVYGNPFRPVTCDPSWRTPTAVGLAEAIYAGRAFDRLPVLADALEEAGCTNADVLAHCRGDGPHARGCWVVDLILGKT